MDKKHITENFDFEATNINEMADWLTRKGKDHAWTCECGSVNFALRGDHKIECNKCGEETGLVWT